jgi:probable HAF family extracellular repeat protein
MKLKTLLASVAVLIFLLGGTALADPTYSVYSNPTLPDGGMLRYGLNDFGSYVGWTYSGGTYFGFMNGPDGSTIPIDPPAAIDTHPTGINNNNLIVGYFSDSSGTHAFMDAGGSYTTLNVPGAVATYAYGVNNIGKVVGYYVDAGGKTHAFVEYAGVFTTIDVPGAVATYGLSINQEGDIVGSYFDGTAVHGFIYHSNGTFEFLDYPGAAVTWLTGINENGLIIGWSQSCDSCEPDPLLKLGNGPLLLAGAVGFEPTGVNDYGLALGYYSQVMPSSMAGYQAPVGGGGGGGGELAPVPEPGTAVLLGAGALALLLAKRFRKKQ